MSQNSTNLIQIKKKIHVQLFGIITPILSHVLLQNLRDLSNYLENLKVLLIPCFELQKKKLIFFNQMHSGLQMEK